MKLDSQAYRECTRCSTRYLSRGDSTASVCHNCRTELKVMENAGSQGCNMTCTDCGTAYHSASGTTKVCPLCRPQVAAPPPAASTFPHTKMPVGPGILSVRNVNTHNSMTGQKRAAEPTVCVEEKAAPAPAPVAQAESSNNDAETARTELLSVSERGGVVSLPPGDWGRPHRRGSFASLASDSVAAAAAAAHHQPAAPTHKAHTGRSAGAGAVRRVEEHGAHRRYAPHMAREEELEEPDFRLPLRPAADELVRPSCSQSPSLSPSSVPVDKPYYEFQPYDKHEMRAPQQPRRHEHWDDDVGVVESRRTSSSHHRRRDSDRSQYRSHHDDRRSSGHHHHHNRHRREDSVDHRSRQHRSHHQTQHRGVPQRRYASVSSRSPSYTTDTYSRTEESSPARGDWCLRDAAAGGGRTTQPQEQQRTQHAQVRGGGSKGDRVPAAAPRVAGQPQSTAVRDTRVPHRRMSGVDDYSDSATGTDAAYRYDCVEERRPRGSDRQHTDRHDLRRRSNRSPNASRSVGTSRTSRTMTSTATNTRATMVDAAVQNDPPSAPLVIDAQPFAQAAQQQQQQQAPPVPSVTATQQPDGPVLFARPLAPPPPTVSVVAAPPPVVMAAPPQYTLQQAPPQLLLQQQATPQAMFAQVPNAAAYAGQATPVLLPSQPQVNTDYVAQAATAAATPQAPGQATQVPYGYTLGPAPGNLPPDLAGDRKRRYYHAGPAAVAAPSSAAPAAAPYVPPPAKPQGRIQSSYTPSPQRTARHRTVNGWDQYVGDGESRSPSRSLSPYDRPDYARHVVSHYNEQGTPAAPPAEAQSPHAIWEAGHTPQMANRAAAAFGRRM